MAILDLQQRMRQLGEIRLGHVVDVPGQTNKRGEQKTRPEKLDKFRFTSPSRPLLERIAELYGGDVQPWAPTPTAPSEFEVYTKADRVPVIIPPLAISQWYESYAGAKCVRRCDGVTEQKSDRPCLCDPENRECKPTTRLNVLLRDVEAIGMWLLTSRGYYAAVELPAYADLLARSGGYVEGWLSIEERRIVRANGEMARFMVPVLEAAVSPAQLLANDQAQPAAIAGGPARQLEAGTPRDWVAEVHGCADVEALTVLLQEAQRAGVAQNLGDQGDPVAVAFVQRRGQLAQAATAPPEDTDALWQQVVAAFPGTMSELQDDFARFNQGTMAEDATAGDFRRYLEHLKTRPPEQAEPAKGEVPF